MDKNIETTDISLFVRSSSDEILNWDRSHIISTLMKETEITLEQASMVSIRVEEQIKLLNLTRITTALVRELVDVELLKEGFEDARRTHTRVGIPMYDVEQMIVYKNKENANIPHNPEASNFHIAEIVKKEYALEHVFSRDVADSHTKGDIHIHDLGCVDRVYTYSGDESIIVKNDNNIVQCISFKQLFNMCNLYYEIPEDNVVIGLLKDWSIYDKDSWSPIKRVVKRLKNRQMYFIKTRNGRSVIVTDNHPFLIKNINTFDRVNAKDLQEGQFVDTIKKINIQSDIDELDLTTTDLCSNSANKVYTLDNVLFKDNGSNMTYMLDNIPVSQYRILKSYGYDLEIKNAIIYSRALRGGNKSKGLPCVLKLTEDLCYFIGLFIAEGSYANNGLDITCNNIYIEKVIKTLDKLDISYAISPKEDSNCCVLRIYSTILRDIIYNYFSMGRGSRNICLPNSTISWKPELSYSLLCGIIDGDGTISNNSIVIRTSSRQMLTQISWLLLSQGIHSCDRYIGGVGSTRIYKEKNIVQRYSIFSVSFYIPSDKYYLFKNSTKCTNVDSPTKSYSVAIDYVKTVMPIDIQDDYIYDITTESGTLRCNGIYCSNCSGNSLSYVSKYGLNLPGLVNIAKPAKHAEVLLAHMMKFSSALQSCFAGAIGWDAVNIFFAPYLVNKSYYEIKQLAQMMIFEFNQQNVSRGDQAMFSDINMYWEIPKHFKNVPAIGPGGIETGKVYGDYLKKSQLFYKAIMEIYLEGDSYGRPYFWPKANCHITEEFFNTDGHEKMLKLLCKVAIERGNTYFIFDRSNEVKISSCCRLKRLLSKYDIEDAITPWKLRFCALQNVTINLPRIGYESGNNKEKSFQLLKGVFSLVVKAHIQKKAFIDNLLSLDTLGPLGLLCMKHDGEEYLRRNKLSYLIGILGLNEMVKIVTGYEMHERQESFMYGLDVISYLYNLAEDIKKDTGMNFILEQAPAETTSHRFAKLDLKRYGKKAASIIKGNIDSGEIYYTNSTYFAANSNIHFIERITKEGMFHKMILAGSLSHIWLGEHKPEVSGITNLIKKIFYNTRNDQVAISPEFTICNKCNRTERGLREKCSFCGSDDIDGITRITGYFSKISSWNKGKLGELRDRNRESI